MSVRPFSHMQWNKIGKYELTFVLWQVFIEAIGHWTRWHTAVGCMISPSFHQCPLCNWVSCVTESGLGKCKQGWALPGRAVLGAALVKGTPPEIGTSVEVSSLKGGFSFPHQRPGNLQPITESRIYTFIFIFVFRQSIKS